MARQPIISQAKTSHVNLMIDTVIANAPPDALRSILRALLASNPQITHALEEEARKYLIRMSKLNVYPDSLTYLEKGKPAKELDLFLGHVRSMLGCGLGFESLRLLGILVKRASELESPDSAFQDRLAEIDGDIVQAATAINASLIDDFGTRDPTSEEKILRDDFVATLLNAHRHAMAQGKTFNFPRGLDSFDPTQSISGLLTPDGFDGLDSSCQLTPVETFQLGDALVPRIFMGLWQLSSPAWGSASQSKMMHQFRRHVNAGLTAFGTNNHVYAFNED
jgi:hypothetical protein